MRSGAPGDPRTDGPRWWQRRFRTATWTWWWHQPAQFAIEAPGIHTPGYRAALHRDVDRAIAAGAIDAYAAHIFDAKIRADRDADLAELAENWSRRRTLATEQVERHDKRAAAAQRRLDRITERLTAEESNLAAIDRDLADRRPPVTSSGAVVDLPLRRRDDLREKGA